MILAVSGWRNWTDHIFVIRQLRGYMNMYGPSLHVRVGDATGVDEITRQWLTFQSTVHRIHIDHTIYYADWEKFGRPMAGPIRNGQMLRGENEQDPDFGIHADVLLAMPQPGVKMRSPGSGTVGCLMEAHLLGINIDVPGYTIK
jgi:hypothetical protein